MKFGAKLQECRVAKPLTQQALAERVGVTVGAVRDYEQGRRLPSLLVFFRMARVLGVSADEFGDCDEVAEKKQKGKGKP